MRWCRTSLSKHFMSTGVSATGLQSFRLLMVFFCGTGIMVAAFRQDGMVACFMEVFKILVKTPDSWSVQAFSTFPSTPSVALSGFTAFRT